MKSLNSHLFFVYIVIVIILGSMGTIIIFLTPGSVRMIIGLVLVGGIIVFTAFLYYVFSRFLKPVRLVTFTVEEIAKGNYEQSIPVHGEGDIAKLNRSINMLSESLQEVTAHEEHQETQLRTVIDNMQSGLMMIDDKGYVQLINRTFLHLFGGQDKDYKGFLYYDKLTEKKIHQVVQKAFLYEEKIKKSLEIYSGSKHTEKNYVEIVGAPLLDDQQYVKGVVLVFHDITELKRVEEMRKDFVANVSHELKTPITSIRGFAETLIDGAAEDKELRAQFLSIILMESQRLQSLVHDLLELSKLDKEEIQFKYARVNMAQLIQEVLPIVRQQSAEKNINFQSTIADDIEIDGDHELLKQLFLNLLSNAIHYTSDGGEVILEITNQEEAIRILVADTGIGIPQEMQTRIFERFFRVDWARSRNTGGTGLGLAIVKHIVEAHMGTIQVKSEENVGTSIVVVIPEKM